MKPLITIVGGCCAGPWRHNVSSRYEREGRDQKVVLISYRLTFVCRKILD